MATFEECLDYALKNSGLFSDHRIQLKEKQLETLKTLFDNRDCITILPTGYGKSIIFQMLPWFFMRKRNMSEPALTIVVTPLSSLMRDQIVGLRQKGVKACSLNIKGTHGMTYEEDNVSDDEGGASGDKADIGVLQSDVDFGRLKNGEFPLIYAHPESLRHTQFSKLLRTTVFRERVCAVVVDEVHMVSEWGKDFRPEFQQLGELVCLFDSAAHLALTATATDYSVQRLADILNFRDYAVIKSNIDRPNIYINVKTRLPNVQKFEKLDNIIKPICEELIEKKTLFPVTIIYVESLESLGYFYQFLAHELGESQYCGPSIPQNRIFGQFHKDYTETMKSAIIDQLKKTVPVLRLVLATVSLGMGVNSPSVERIIHCRPPTTIENYFQEIGRSGRLGQEANAIMFFNKSDIAKNRPGFTDTMRQYCLTTGCYRRFIVKYFGFDNVLYNGDVRNCCSNCRKNVE